MSIERISTHDGLSLVVEHHSVAQVRLRLLLVHGYAEHRGRYAQLVQELAAHGVECHLFDLRGHGESGGSRGHVAHFESYLDDLHRVIATLPPRDQHAPLVLLAHSLGSLIALCYVRAHSEAFDAFAVSSPFLGPAFAVPASRLLLARILSKLAPALHLESGLRPEWVSHDSNVVVAYAADPHVFSTTTPRWFTEVAAAQRDLLAHANEITTPALFLVAGSDRIANHHLSQQLFANLGTPAAKKQLHTYPDLYHEIFNELPMLREVVLRDLFSWLEDLSARPAG